MATMAKWGSKTWAVSSKKVVALEGLGFSYTQIADGDPPKKATKATKRGVELVTFTFTTMLHSAAGVDVRSEIASWEKLVTQVNRLYINGKKMGPKLQLRKVTVTDVKMDDLGRMRTAKLSFEFKEYDKGTTSVVVKNSATGVVSAAIDKVQKKVQNTSVKKAATKTVKVGDYVKPTGKKYATGEKIPAWVKQRKHKVSKIKGKKVLLGHPNGINSWVYLNEVTLV